MFKDYQVKFIILYHNRIPIFNMIKIILYLNTNITYQLNKGTINFNLFIWREQHRQI